MFELVDMFGHSCLASASWLQLAQGLWLHPKCKACQVIASTCSLAAASQQPEEPPLVNSPGGVLASLLLTAHVYLDISAACDLLARCLVLGRQ